MDDYMIGGFPLNLPERLTVLTEQQIAELQAQVRDKLFSIPFGPVEQAGEQDTSVHP